MYRVYIRVILGLYGDNGIITWKLQLRVKPIGVILGLSWNLNYLRGAQDLYSGLTLRYLD